MLVRVWSSSATCRISVSCSSKKTVLGSVCLSLSTRPCSVWLPVCASFACLFVPPLILDFASEALSRRSALRRPRFPRARSEMACAESTPHLTSSRLRLLLASIAGSWTPATPFAPPSALAKGWKTKESTACMLAGSSRARALFVARGCAARKDLPIPRTAAILPLALKVEGTSACPACPMS